METVGLQQSRPETTGSTSSLSSACSKVHRDGTIALELAVGLKSLMVIGPGTRVQSRILAVTQQLNSLFSFFLSLCLSLCLSLSVSISVSLCLSVSLSLYVSDKR